MADSRCIIFELDSKGALLRTISTSGFNDLEGICHYKGNEYFLADEYRSEVVRVSIPETGNGPVNKNEGIVFPVGLPAGNEGIEGVSYCASNNTLYAVKEKNPPRLYTLPLTSGAEVDSVIPNAPFNIEANGGDAADIAALSDGNFIVLNQEKNLLIGYDPDGRALSELSLAAMRQPEGLAVDNSDGTLYVSGEPAQFAVFRKKETAASAWTPNVPTGFNASFHAGLQPKSVVCGFSLPRPMHIAIDLFSADGKRRPAASRQVGAGAHSIEFPLKAQRSGLVIYRFTAGSFTYIVKYIRVP